MPIDLEPQTPATPAAEPPVVSESPPPPTTDSQPPGTSSTPSAPTVPTDGDVHVAANDTPGPSAETLPETADAEAAAPLGEQAIENPDQAGVDGLEGEFKLRFALLAGHQEMFYDAMTMSMGGDMNREAAENYRQLALKEDFSWLPELRFTEADNLGGRRSHYDAASGTITLDRALLADRNAAVAAYTDEAARHIGATVNARGADGTISEYFRYFADPFTDPYVDRYLAGEPADVSSPPFGLEMFEYGSKPGDSGAVIFSDTQPHYINGGIGTPPKVAQIRNAGGGNFLNPAWMQVVDDAVARNGGLGNAEDGFLAFSKDHGFVRLRNTGLTPEQNRQFAAISLQTGWSLEDLPTRTGDNAFLDPNIGRWADEFIDSYAAEFQDFLANPLENGIHVKSGSKRDYVLKYNEDANGFVSYYSRKSGGFRGFVQKNFEYIMYGVGAVATIMTLGGAAPAVAAAFASMTSTAFSYVATGTLRASQAIGAAVSGIGAAFGFSGTQAVVANAAAQIGGDLADDGDLDMGADEIVATFTPLIAGLPGGPVVDHAVRESLEIIAGLAEGEELSAQDLVGALAPLVFELPEGAARDQLAAIAQQVDGGNLTATQVSEAIKPLFDGLTGDPRADMLVLQTLEILAGAIDGEDVRATDVLQAVEGYFLESIEGTRTGQILAGVAELGAEYADNGTVDVGDAFEVFEDVTGLEGEDLLDYVFGSDDREQVGPGQAA